MPDNSDERSKRGFITIGGPEHYVDIDYGSGSDEHVIAISCGRGEVIDASGKCVKPHVSRNVYVYSPPYIPQVRPPKPKIPKPRVEYNVIFVRTPDRPEPLDPVVIPPPQLKTFVYILTKNGKIEQKVIEIPEYHKETPEVIFVNYNEGENPELSDGINLHQILNSKEVEHEHDYHRITAKSHSHY